ncbi:MAG: hypothetical protein ACRC6U_08415 [Fusobacteriaceae bacterium]
MLKAFYKFKLLNIMSENNKKIKSVTFKAVTYSVPDWEVEFQEDNYIRLYTTYTSFWFPKSKVKIEYEPQKPKQYFNKNNSVQLPLEENQDYWFIYGRGVGNTYWSGEEEDLYMLKTENIFLTEEDAQKALDQKNKGLEVLEILKKINRENDWVDGFSGGLDYKNYYVRKTGATPYVDYSHDIDNQGTFYFCKKASDYFKGLPKEDKKAFFNLKF